MARGGIVAGGVVVAAAAAAVWFFVGSSPSSGPVVEGDAASDAADPAVAAAELAGGRKPAAVTPGAPVATYAATIRGRVTGPAGAGVPNVPVLLRVDPIRESQGGIDPAQRGKTETDRLRKLLAALDEPKVEDEAAALKTTTDADGKFQVTVDTPGGWSAEVRPAPPLCGGRGYVWLRREATEAMILVPLTTGAALKGRVVDEKDKPLAAVVAGTWTAAEKGGPLAPVATDPATGAFELPPTPPGRATLTVRVAGRGEVSVRTPVPAAEPFVIRVPAGGVVVGRVTDPSGAPVADVDVLVVSGPREPPPTGVSGGQARGRSGADGSFRLTGVVAGRVSRVSMLAPSRPARTEVAGSARWTGAEVRDGTETRIDLVLGRGGVVAGKVTEAGTNVPVGDADVYLFPGRTAGGGSVEAVHVRVDERGAFRIEDVPFGRYAVMPTSPRHYFAPAVARNDMVWDGSGNAADAPVVVVAAEGEVVERDLVLTPGLTVRGSVRGPGGTPVAGADVRAPNAAPLYQAAWNWGVNFTLGNQPLATSDAEGAFVIANLPPSVELMLTASKPPLVGEASEKLKLTEGGAPPPPVVLTLGVGATVLGRVVDADGKPLANRGVTWNSEDPKAPGWGNVTTDDDGRFRAEGVAPTSVRFQTQPAFSQGWGVSRGGAGAASVKVDPPLKAGEVRDGIELRVGRMAYLRGVAVDETGKPVAGANLFLQGPTMQQVTTTEDGTFDVTVPEGSYQIGLRMANGWGIEGGTLAAKAPADNLRVVVVARERTFTLLGGKIVAADGTPVPLCTVNLSASDGNVFRSEEVLGGEFHLEVERKPPFTLMASLPRGSRGEGLNLRSNKVTVEKDATDLVLTLEKGLQVKGRVLDPAGEPVAGVMVRAGANGGTSDATGAFVVSGLESGDPVGLQIQPPVKFVAPPGVTARPGGEEVVVRLTAGGFVAGRVVGLDEVKGAQAWVYVQTGNGRASPVAADGTFRVEGLPADGNVDLGVNTWSGTGGSPFVNTTVKGVRIGTDDVVITLTRGVFVRGMLVDADGAPATGSYWLQAAAAEGGDNAAGQVSGDGKFALGAMRPGTYTVTVHNPNGGVLLSNQKVEAPSEGVRITLPRLRTVAGRVNGGGGKPATLTVFKKTEGGRQQVAYAQVGTDGRFSLEVAGDGPFALNVMAEDKYGRAENVVPGTEVEVNLAQGLEISGIVEPDARSGAGNYVMAEGDGWSNGANCEADGTFRVRGLPPGRYHLKLYSQETWKDPGTGTPVDAGATNVRLR